MCACIELSKGVLDRTVKMCSCIELSKSVLG